MSFTEKSFIQANDTPSIDAFARWRVSNPFTLFDSKQINDNQPLFWDDSEVSGSGTQSTYQSNKAATQLSVADLTAGKRVRQTFQKFNYQPGKSQLILLTFANLAALSGNAKEVGYGDDKNGLFFYNDGGTMYVRKRAYNTGSAVNTDVVQTSWNLDTLNGNGPSGVNLDFRKTQIGIIDMEWLGVGRVRMGFVIDGIPIYCHEFLHANSTDEVYMSTPNLPVHYSIENDGTGLEDTFDHICASVQSEGGSEKTGVLRHADSGSIGTLSNANTYAILGIRLSNDYLDISVLIENISAFATTTNDRAHWELVFNPTVAGTFTYSALTNSAVQVATGSSSNTVTGGYAIDGGFFTNEIPTSPTTPNALRLGAAIDGTVDEIVLCVRPITNNIEVEGALTWRELL
jgi:hypothetical protein